MYERFTDRARKVMQLANQEAQRKQRYHDAKTAEEIDEALQQGKQRPDEDAPKVAPFGAEAIQ